MQRETETEIDKQRHREIETWGEDKVSSKAIATEERRREMCVKQMCLKIWCLWVYWEHIFFFLSSLAVARLLLRIQGQICERAQPEQSPLHASLPYLFKL